MRVPHFICRALATLSAVLFPMTCSAAVTATGDVNPNPLVAELDVTIGAVGYGQVVIDGGSQFASHRIELGDYSGNSIGGFAGVRVSGAGSQWEAQELEFRRPRAAAIEVLDGGFLRVDGVTNYEGAPVSVRVSGAQSTLGITNYTNPGLFGAPAEIEVSDGGAIILSNGYGLDLAEDSELVLEDGTVSADRLENQGVIRGDGELYVAGGVNTGRIEVGAGQRLLIRQTQSQHFNNLGEISVRGGELEFVGRLNNEMDFRQGPTRGAITLENGALRFDDEDGGNAGLQNETQLAAIGGVSDLHGRVQSQHGSSIALTNDSVLRFHDPVELIGGTLSVFAGSRAVFLDGLSMQNATLFAQLTGQPGGGAYGVAEVVGELIVDGQVQFSLTDAYAAQAGDWFPLITASGGVTGEPSLAAAPPLADGLMWSVQTAGNTLALAVVETLPGDFNADGVVDAADYTVWRDNPSGNYQPSDLQFWRDNYGATIAPAPQTNNAAPEPGAALLVGLVLCGLLTARRTS